MHLSMIEHDSSYSYSLQTASQWSYLCVVPYYLSNRKLITRPSSYWSIVAGTGGLVWLWTLSTSQGAKEACLQAIGAGQATSETFGLLHHYCFGLVRSMHHNSLPISCGRCFYCARLPQTMARFHATARSDCCEWVATCLTRCRPDRI